MFIRARLSVVFCVQNTPWSLGGMAERSMTVLKNSLINFFFPFVSGKKKISPSQVKGFPDAGIFHLRLVLMYLNNSVQKMCR